MAVYADLRGAEGEEAAVRDSILAEYGVTEDELRRFVHHHAERPRVLADIWAEITAEVPRPEEAVDPEPDAPEVEGARPQTPMEDPAMPEAVRPRREPPPFDGGGGEEPLPRPPSQPEL